MKVFSSILLLGASATSVSALPHYPNRHHGWSNSKTPSSCHCFLDPSLPQPILDSNPADRLPAPDSGLSLKRVAIGYGHQLYSCQNLGAEAAPAAAGAKATLYDANCAAANPYLGTVPRAIVSANLNEGAVRNLLRRAGESEPRPVAEHYFLDATTPKFEFTDGSGDVFVGMVGARLNITTGPAAVAWLKLVEKTGREGESDITEVYRLETAHGVPPKTCGQYAGSPNQIQVPYAAEYWFYG